MKKYFPGDHALRKKLNHSWIQVISTILIILLNLSSCKNRVTTHPTRQEAETTFQQLLEEAIYDSFEQVPGVSMSVLAPDLDIRWTGATGFDSSEKDQKLSADQPFRIASITKTFVAAAILRLYEMGRLSIDDKIEKYISEQHQQILIAGGYAPDSITLRQCLNHTSGLFDYAMGSRSFIEMSKTDPQRRWTRTEQLQLAMELGPRTGNPGEGYRYNDTGYILLGEIIETQMDSTLGYGLSSLLGFEKLKLKSTWLESIDPQTEGLKDFVHCYLGSYDATESDPSVDLYGGGGLASTTAELAIFMQALFNHQVFDKNSTLDLMMEKPTYDSAYDYENDRRYKDYRQGFWEVSIYGEKAYIHSGLWGAHLLHVPAYNCTVALNYTKGNRSRLMKKAIHVIRNLNQG